MHKVLARQLKREFGHQSKVPDSITNILKVVDDTYQAFDEDRALTERSLDISSKEISSIQKRYISIIENSPFGVCVVKKSGEVDFANKRVAEVLGGKSSSAFVGSNINKLVDKYETADLQKAIKKGFSGEIFDVQVKLVDSNKVRKIHNYRGVPVFDEISQDKVVSIVLFIDDVSEKIDAGEQLEDMATFAKYNPFPVIRLDSDLVVLRYNPSAEEYFGESLGVGVVWTNICEWIVKSKFINRVKKELTVKQTVKVNDTYLSLVNKYLEQENVIHIYAFDITAQKQAEIKLRDQKDDLKKLNLVMVNRELKMIDLKKRIKLQDSKKVITQ